MKFPAFFLLLIVTHATNANIVDNIKSHIQFLSSDSLQGRAVNTLGSNKAAIYIAESFSKVGLKPVNQSSYFQPFHIPELSVDEKNVVGFIPASKQTKESIVFIAHYDTVMTPESSFDKGNIYKGALDNASGVGMLIELARLYKSGDPPQANIVFIASAAEEIGGFGAKHYIENPLFPNEHILMSLNIDGINVTGERLDYFVMPKQGINFLPVIQKAANSIGWQYRSAGWEDQMNKKFDSAYFLAEGVPSVTLWVGNTLKNGKPANNIKLGNIHSSDDQINGNWNWEGVEDHVNLYRAVAEAFMSNTTKATVTSPQLFR